MIYLVVEYFDYIVENMVFIIMRYQLFIIGLKQVYYFFIKCVNLENVILGGGDIYWKGVKVYYR